jgi:O-succinylbenzoate synthase
MSIIKTKIITIPCSDPAFNLYGLKERLVLIASLENSHTRAWAEYAPWPGIHHVDIHHAQKMLQNINPRDLDDLCDLDHGLSCYDLALFFKKRWPYPLSYILSSLAFSLNNYHCSPDIQVTLSALVLNNIYTYKNFKYLKIKIGRNLHDEIALINTITPQHIIRLDANKKLNTSNYKNILDNINISNINYIEEPFLDLKNNSYIIDNYNIAIALDESWDEDSSWDYIEATRARYLIIKPSRFSSIYWVMNKAKEAKEHNIIPIISSSFEWIYSASLYAMLVYTIDMIDETHGIWISDFFASSSNNKEIYIKPCDALSLLREEL